MAKRKSKSENKIQVVPAPEEVQQEEAILEEHTLLNEEDDIQVTFDSDEDAAFAVFDSSEAEEELSDEDHFELGTEHIVLDKPTLETVQSKIKALPQSDEKGVVYLGRIPHGFYEKEMREYFSQFGEISRLRLSRNKKTGKSKHYAFIEFESDQVAKIVAETMNNYLLFGHLLKCEWVPAEKVHAATFKGADRVFKKIPWTKIQRNKHNKERTTDQERKRVQKLIEKERQKRQKLVELGVDYDFPGYAAELKAKK